MVNKGLKHSTRLYVFVLIIFIVAIYILLHTKYRIENADDAWSLSFLYNYLEKGGVENDLVFGSNYIGCIRFAGKFHAFIYGPILNLFGWTKHTSHVISTFFMVLAALIWYHILRLLKFRPLFSLIFVLLLLWLEPFFGAANQARPDSLTFAIVSLSFWLFLSKRYFLSGLFALIGVETHPMGIMTFFYFTSYFIAEYQKFVLDKKALLRNIGYFSIGLLVGTGIYVFLHIDGLLTLSDAIKHSLDSQARINNYLYAYFFETKFLRHLPELFIIISSLFIYLKRCYFRQNKFVFVFLSVLFLSTLIICRPNFHYTIFVYPAFLLIVLYVAERYGRLRWAVLGYIILLVPQYGYIYYKNHAYDFEAYIRLVKNAVPANNLPVLASPNHWFVFMDRDFFALSYRNIDELGLTNFYLIENNAYRRGDFAKTKEYFDKYYKREEIEKFRYFSGKYAIYKVSKLEMAK